MNNKYSIGLLLITGALLLIGGLGLFHGHLLSFIPLFLGVAMLLKGFRELSAANPKEYGLITFFGIRTKTVVKGLIFMLDWLPFDIVGVTVFDMRKVDKDFPIESIRCCDGVRVGGREAVSISLSPDENNLGEFDDAEQMDGIHLQVDDMLPAWLQEIARQDGHDYKWMETHTSEIRDELYRRLTTPNTKGSLIGLGVVINKLQVKLHPNNPDVIKADESSVIEILDRKGQELDTETINKQVNARYQRYIQEWRDAGSPPDKKPSWKKCRREIFDERLAKAGKYQKIVNKGGVNVTETAKGVV